MSISAYSSARNYRTIFDDAVIQRKIETQTEIAQLHKTDDPSDVSEGLTVEYKYITPQSFSYDFPDKTELFTIQNLPICGEVSCTVEVAEFLGGRPTQEDSFVASSFKIETPDGRDHTVLLTGVLDGHGGKNAALYVKDNLQKKLETLFSSLFNKSLKEWHPLKGFENETTLSDKVIWNVLKIACVELHDDLPRSCYGEGTTAAFSLLIDGEDLWHACVGDSRSFVTSKEKTIQLSEDMRMRFEFPLYRREYHFNKIEAAFKATYEPKDNATLCIESLQEQLTNCLGLPHKSLEKDLNKLLLEREKVQKSNFYERSIWKRGGYIGNDRRLNGCLAMPRSIGDKHLRDGLCPRPKITKISLSKDFPDSKFCTLVHACDGLWDVTTTEQVADAINNDLSPLAQIAANLTYSATEARVTYPPKEELYPSDNVSTVMTRIDLRALREARK